MKLPLKAIAIAFYKIHPNKKAPPCGEAFLLSNLED